MWFFFFFCLATFLNASEKLPQPKTNYALLAHKRQGTPYAKGSWLVWQSKIWGLEFAAKSYIPTETAPASTFNTFEEKLYIPDFAWKPGVKIDFGYQLPCDGWDLNTRWTYYHAHFTSLKKHFEAEINPPGIGVIPLWFYPFFYTSFGANGEPVRYRSAAANWNFNFNSIDLEFGRASIIHRNVLLLRFIAGAKGAWMRQHYHADYANGTTVQALRIRDEATRNLQLLSSRFAHGQHSWSLGPRLGLDSTWPIGCGFNLIGNGAFSLLYSFFRTATEFDDLVIEGTTPLSLRLHRNEKFHELTPVLEARFGFGWGTHFGKQKNPYGIDLAISYEWQYWWSQNHVRRNYTAINPGATFDARGDLQMHGLNASLRFDF